MKEETILNKNENKTKKQSTTRTRLSDGTRTHDGDGICLQRTSIGFSYENGVSVTDERHIVHLTVVDKGLVGLHVELFRTEVEELGEVHGGRNGDHLGIKRRETKTNKRVRISYERRKVAREKIRNSKECRYCSGDIFKLHAPKYIRNDETIGRGRQGRTFLAEGLPFLAIVHRVLIVMCKQKREGGKREEEKINKETGEFLADQKLRKPTGRKMKKSQKRERERERKARKKDCQQDCVKRTK